MRALIQLKNGVPYSTPALIAAEGFRQRGYELVNFEVDEIDTRDWQREEPVVGGVGTVSRILRRLEIPWSAVTYPQDLAGYLGRKVETIQLGTLTREQLPAFIKPKQDSKKFTGFVAFDIFDRRLAGAPADMEIYLCEEVEFVTEYRVYVLGGKILNIARYRGPVEAQPSIPKIRGMILSYLHAPIAYSLDVGVTNTGKTLLVETNDAFSLGNYGLAPALAAKMIAARWNQVVGLDYRDEADCHDCPAFISLG